MTSAKKIKKDRAETLKAKKVSLPTLNIEDAWLDKIDAAKDLSEKIKKILYLPTIAHATAIYVHDNNLCRDEKDLIMLLFQ